MRNARYSGHLGEGGLPRGGLCLGSCLPGGVCPGEGVCLGWCTPFFAHCMLGYTPPIDRILETYWRKHYLPATTVAGGIYISGCNPPRLKLSFVNLFIHWSLKLLFAWISPFITVALLAFMSICLVVISKWPSLSHRLSWFWWIEY